MPASGQVVVDSTAGDGNGVGVTLACICCCTPPAGADRSG